MVNVFRTEAIVVVKERVQVMVLIVIVVEVVELLLEGVVDQVVWYLRRPLVWRRYQVSFEQSPVVCCCCCCCLVLVRVRVRVRVVVVSPSSMMASVTGSTRGRGGGELR